MMQAMPKPWMSLRIKLVAMKAALQEINHALPHLDGDEIGETEENIGAPDQNAAEDEHWEVAVAREYHFSQNGAGKHTEHVEETRI